MQQPFYTIAEMRIVADVPGADGKGRRVALPRPMVTFRGHDGPTGEQVFAETGHASRWNDR